MDRDAYLGDPHVRDFVAWAAPLVSGKRPLRHHWESRRLGSWCFETIHDAYGRYDWPFRCSLPGDSAPRRGRTYADTVEVLDELGQLLRRSRDEKDAACFLDVAVAVLEWGRVRRGERRLRALGDQALPALSDTARLLDPAAADLRRLSDVSLMNSGLSKIYSLLCDGLPIYDSRVACGLASLVRLFCEETDRRDVPAPLAFGIPPGQARARRDPSCGPLIFPRIWTPRRYARSNVMAAWLLDVLSEQSPFAELGSERRRALQSAMFMIGYTVYRARREIRNGRPWGAGSRLGYFPSLGRRGPWCTEGPGRGRRLSGSTTGAAPSPSPNYPRHSRASHHTRSRTASASSRGSCRASHPPGRPAADATVGPALVGPPARRGYAADPLRPVARGWEASAVPRSSCLRRRSSRWPARASLPLSSGRYATL